MLLPKPCMYCAAQLLQRSVERTGGRGLLGRAGRLLRLLHLLLWGQRFWPHLQHGSKGRQQEAGAEGPDGEQVLGQGSERLRAAPVYGSDSVYGLPVSQLVPASGPGLHSARWLLAMLPSQSHKAL